MECRHSSKSVDEVEEEKVEKVEEDEKDQSALEQHSLAVLAIRQVEW